MTARSELLAALVIRFVEFREGGMDLTDDQSVRSLSGSLEDPEECHKVFLFLRQKFQTEHHVEEFHRVIERQ